MSLFVFAKNIIPYRKGLLVMEALQKNITFLVRVQYQPGLLLFRVLGQKEFLVLAKRKVILFNLSCMQ